MRERNSNMAHPKPVLVIRTGRAPDPIRARHGDFPHWLRLACGVPLARWHTVDVAGGEPLPAPAEVCGALITGSAAMVTDRADWSEKVAGWIRHAMDAQLPMFGVCYGHQLMAHALGGRVGYLAGGREIGTLPIELSPHAASDRLAASLPRVFQAHTTHEQSVLEAPSGATVLARSARDPHHLLRYGENALSAQFHPEFSADVMRAYIHRKREAMGREGVEVQPVYRQVAATPVARRLLHLFARQHGLQGPASFSAWAEPETG